MSHPHLEFLQRWFERAWTGRDEGAIDELIHPEASLYSAAGAEPMSRGEFKAFHRAVLQAYSRVEATLSQPICEGEWISVHVELRLVPRAADQQPSEARALQGLLRVRVREGRIVSAMESWDWPRFLEARGLLSSEALTEALLGATPS